MIFNMIGGGGGSGATLVVSSPANVSVTVSKDDKSYTKNSGSLGSTTFKGLATGTWTVTISGNGQTATKAIEITADYAITIAFFSASINITYPATSTCVVTNSGGQTVASDTNATSSEKTWTATVNAVGIYTVTATATDGSGKARSTTVSIATDGQSESVTLNYYLAVLENGVLSPLTGGIDVINQNTKFKDGKIVCKSLTLSQGNYFTTNSAINMAPYSTLYCRIKFVKKREYDGRFGLTTTKLTDIPLDEALKLFTTYYNTKNPSITSGTIKEISLDISNVSTYSYIALCGMDDLEIDTIILYP